MGSVLTSLARAILQMADGVVLAVFAKTLLVTLAVFAALGAGLYAALLALFARFGWESGGLAEAAAAALIAVTAFWLLFRIVALAVLQFFADEIVAAVEQRHYQEAASAAQPVPFRRDVANALRGIARALLVNAIALPVAIALWFTGIGSALVLLAANAVLLGRELTDMTWLRYAGEGANPADRPANPVPKLEQAALGGAIAALMLVPLVNFVAPLIGAAAGAHLTHRRMGELGGQA